VSSLSTAAARFVTMAEIAEIAQVRRPVVTTWRRRYADFPAPLRGDAGRLLFDGRAVVGWLIGSGLGNADPARLSAELVLHSITAPADLASPARLVEIIGSLLCLRHLDQQPLVSDQPGEDVDPAEAWAGLLRRAQRIDPEDEFVLRELRSADDSAVALARTAEDLVEAAYTPGAAYEWLLDSRRRGSLTELAADAVTDQLRRLLVELADSQSRIEDRGSLAVADPHAGSGDLLAAIVRAVEDPAQVVALAAEPDGWLARLTRRRLLLAGVGELGLDVQIGTELEERLTDPDLIVTQLPYTPGETRSKLAALRGVERIGDLLGPGRTALVLGPADALVDQLGGVEGARLRAELLRTGIVEAVINLPGGVSPYRPGYRSALWVLTRDPVRTARGYVLLADVSAEPLTDRVRERLAEDVLLWRAEGRRVDGHDPRYGRVVPIAELAQRRGDPLTPPGPPASQVLARAVTDRPALIAEAEGRLERAAEDLRLDADTHGPLRGNVIRRTGPRPATTTVGALIAAGRLTKVKGHRIDPGHIRSDGHYNVLGPEEICGASPVGARRVDRAVLAAAYERVAFTEPGDVVYTAAPRLGVIVDHDGTSVVAFPARILRVNPSAERPLAPRVLAALLAAARNTARSPSAVRPALRIEDVALPALDPLDVDHVDALLADIERRQALLRAQDEALADVRRLTVAGIADGTLTVEDPLI
jgi:hypothetical protein